MKTRAPIHLGSGEPVLLLHPFLMSQLVWQKVAPQLADTGRYEVFAPTMAGHNGGPRSGTWFLSSAVLADHVERQLDELGWGTATSSATHWAAGWPSNWNVADAHAPSPASRRPAAGRAWSPTKFEVIAKFVGGYARMGAGPLARAATVAAADRPPDRDPADQRIARRDQRRRPRSPSSTTSTHCPAYFQLLVKSLLTPGLRRAGAHRRSHASGALRKVTGCSPDRASAGISPTSLPADHELTILDGVGHIPMFEAPGRVTEVDQRVPRRVQPADPGRQLELSGAGNRGLVRGCPRPR